MASECGLDRCGEELAVLQPLEFGTVLRMQVPLCRDHSRTWEDFAAHLEEALKKNARDARNAQIVWDFALTYAAFPPHSKG